MKSILLIGACGSGKTWVMNELIKTYNTNIAGKYNLIHFRTNKKICVLGVYDGSLYQGSDKLSMSCSIDFINFKKICLKEKWILIGEGQRFTNKKFINIFNPCVIKIKDDGLNGRLKRNSNQSERHLKTINTQVKNINEHFLVENSDIALILIKKIIDDETY